MRIVIQRVTEASVTIDECLRGQIGLGLLVLVGIEASDGEEDVAWLCRKVVSLRIFNDEQGRMNHSIQDVQGDVLAISQFTLHASTKKGNRPSYVRAATPDFAVPLYESFLQGLESSLGRAVQRGEFGADMKVRLLNDGPVTISIDSKNRE